MSGASHLATQQAMEKEGKKAYTNEKDKDKKPRGKK